MWLKTNQFLFNPSGSSSIIAVPFAKPTTLAEAAAHDRQHTYNNRQSYTTQSGGAGTYGGG